MTSSEFPTEADLEDFTEAAVDEGEEEVVEDRNYYYDAFKGDGRHEESPTQSSRHGTAAEKEISYGVRGNPTESRGCEVHLVVIYLEFVNIL